MRTPIGTSVSVVVDRASDVPVYQQVYEGVCEQIATGALGEGVRLPSVRQMANDLGVSRPTVERAYTQLAVEGYVDNLPRSGYVVRALDTDFLAQARPPRMSGLSRAVVDASSSNTAAASSASPRIEIPPARIAYFEEFAADVPGVRYDFAFARLAPRSFPVRPWLGAYEDAVRYGGDDLLHNYPFDDRPSRLQRALVAYLRRARNVVCAPEQIVVLPSTEFALEVALQLFDPAHDAVGCEEPGFTSLVDVARRLHFRVEPVTCDQGAQAYLADVRRAAPRVLFATPSHQFPTGRIMQLDTRIELLKWARENQSFVIEDDSCSEYRFDCGPVASLHSLDADGRVIYLGNFSKTLSPGLRVAYLVLPERLMGRYFERFAFSCSAVPLTVQEALARLIDGGAYERHVRRMIAATRARHDALLSALRTEMGKRVALSGTHAGLHLFARVDGAASGAASQEELIERAAHLGAKVYRSDIYWFEHPAPPNALLVGFSAIVADDIPEGVRALRRAWFG